MAKRIAKFEVVQHGVEWADYWQGCGTAFTEYDSVVTGIGYTEQDAFDDALDQLAQAEDLEDGALDALMEGDTLSDVPATVDWEEDEIDQADECPMWRVSIRYTLS